MVRTHLDRLQHAQDAKSVGILGKSSTRVKDTLLLDREADAERTHRAAVQTQNLAQGDSQNV